MGTIRNHLTNNFLKMLLTLCSLVLVVVAYNFPEKCIETPIRNTKYGPVRGVTKISRGGREFYSFTGIPYAKPPVGSLRFENPQAVEAWKASTIYNATQEPPTCIQRNYLFSNNPPIRGQEDCLYINVYVPKLDPESSTLLPVLVFIHWGGFFTGRSTTGYLGPEYIMDKDVIFVTFNYRLGPFGFLSTLDDEAPGNFGMKDQVLALKWIQESIDCFGGDTKKITISGQSAGAASAHYHMMSPLSKGLFNQVITESGSALNIWALPLNAVRLQATLGQAMFVGCPNTTNTAVIMDCLRNVPAEAVMQSQDYFKTFYGDPITAYGLVIEKETKRNPNPFITKSPLEYLAAGEIANVPWISGTNHDEGILRAPSRIRPREVREALNSNFSYVLKDLMGFTLSNKDPAAVYKNAIKKYLGGQEYVNVSDPSNVQGFVDLYSDRVFVFGAYQAIMQSVAKGNENIYMYSFNYKGNNTYGDYFATTREDINFKWGVSHCDELIYLYQSPDFFSPLKGQDVVMSKILIDMWTNFVISGNPNSQSNSIDAVIWNPLTTKKLGSMKNSDIRLLNITGNIETGPKLQITQGFYPDRMKFWEENSNL